MRTVEPQTHAQLKTLNAQVVIEQTQGLMVCTAFAKGRCHEFRRFKQERPPLTSSQGCLADKGD
jgi:hypothetical protein